MHAVGSPTATFVRPETENKFVRAQDANICKANIRLTKQGSRVPKNRFAPKLCHDAGASSGSESSESESGLDSESDTDASDTDQATASGAESGSDHDARHEAYAQGQSNILRVLGTWAKDDGSQKRSDCRYLQICDCSPQGLLDRRLLPRRNTGGMKSVLLQHCVNFDVEAFCTRGELNSAQIRAVRGVHLVLRAQTCGPVPSNIRERTAVALSIHASLLPSTELPYVRHQVLHKASTFSTRRRTALCVCECVLCVCVRV